MAKKKSTPEKSGESRHARFDEDAGAVFDLLSDAVYVIDSSYKVVYFNEAFVALCAKLGVSRGRIGKTVKTIPFKANNCREECDKVFANGAEIFYVFENNDIDKPYSAKIQRQLLQLNSQDQFVTTRVTDFSGRDPQQDDSEDTDDLCNAIIENSPIGITIRSSNGTLLGYNEAWKQTWGITDKEIKERITRKRKKLKFDIQDDYLGKYKDQVKEIYEKGGQLYIPAIELFSKRKNRIIWVSQRFYALLNVDNSVNRVVIMTEDITERIISEEALRTSEGKYKLLVSNIPASIAILNYAGEFEYINNYGAAKRGTTPEKLLKKKFYTVYPRKMAQDRLKDIRNVIDTGKKLHVESKTILGDNEFWHDTLIEPMASTDGTITSVLVIAFDITKRKQAEQELQVSEERYRFLLEKMPSSILIIDNNGNLNYVNEFAAVRRGISAEKMMSMNLKDFYSPKDADYLISSIQEVLNKDKGVHEETHLSLNDKSMWYDSYVRPLKEGKNKAKEVIIIANDITERKNMEVDLIEAHKDLELKVKKRTRELAEANEQLRVERESLHQKNIALKEILNQIEAGKKQMSAGIQSNVDKIIIPILETLERKTADPLQGYIKLLKKNLNDIASPFLNSLEVQYAKLTPRELQVCSHIKNGLSCKDIAQQLEISVQTVLKQRAAIRKKLGIANKKINLASYLNSMQQ